MLYKVLLVLSIVCVNQTQSRITTVDDLEIFYRTCLSANPNNTLVIFDLDEVITISTDRALQGTLRKNNLHDLFYKATQDYKGIDFVHAYSWSACGLCLIDPFIKQIHNYLKDNNIKTIGLTYGWGGPLADSEAFEQTRVQRLGALGIHFDWSFNDEALIYFKDISNAGRHPLFYKGIIFSCGITKSNVLEKFFEYKNYWPQKILFIDDMVKNLHDIENLCKQKNIEFEGFLYNGAQKLIMPLDEQLADFQLNYLIEHKKWLTDEQAGKMLAVQR